MAGLETLVVVWATEASGSEATVKCPGPDVEAHRLEASVGLAVVHAGLQQETGSVLTMNTARRLLSCALGNGLQLSSRCRTPVGSPGTGKRN